MVEGGGTRLGGLGRLFLVDEGVELVVVEILEFELALGDFGTWVAGARHLGDNLIWVSSNSGAREEQRRFYFEQFLRSMRLFLVYCYTYGGA